MIKICPNCNQRYVVGFDCNDVEHKCNSGNDALDNEDVIVTGDWEDYDGSGTRHPQDVLRQGSHNELQGTTAGIEGVDKEELTRRGKRASTRRQRQHIEFINIKKEGLC